MPEKTKYYVDNTGNYIGGFCGLSPSYDEKGVQIYTGWEDIIQLIPQGAIEVPKAPNDANQKWDFVNNTWFAL